MKKCKNCGYKSPDSAKYCLQCGESLSAPEHRNRSFLKGFARILIGLIFLLLVYVLFCFFTGRKLVPFPIQSKENADRYYSDELYYQNPGKDNLQKRENGTAYVKNELIVTTKKGVSKDRLNRMCLRAGGQIVGEIQKANIYQIEFGKRISARLLGEKKSWFEEQPEIQTVRTNDIYKFSNESESYPKDVKIPNDEYWSNDWSEIPDGGNWYMEAMHAHKAWKYIEDKTTKRVDFTVLEGRPVNTEHEDLKNNFRGEKIYNRHLGKEEDAVSDHPTAVIGIAGAQFDNQTGIAGLIPNVNLDAVSLSGIESDQSQAEEADSTLMELETSLAYLIETYGKRQTVIINISQSLSVVAFTADRGDQEARAYLDTLNGALTELLEEYLNKKYDFLIVKGAGNSNAIGNKFFLKVDDEDAEDAEFGYINIGRASSKKIVEKYKNRSDFLSRLDGGNVDAQYDFLAGITKERLKQRIVVVGACTMLNNSHEEYKVSTFSNCGDRVDVVAPGENMDVLTYHGYGENSGTSFAAPCAAGVAGLQLSLYPTLTGAQLKYLLVDSAKLRCEGRMDGKNYEYRMVDAFEAVQKAYKTKKYTPFIHDRSTSADSDTEDKSETTTETTTESTAETTTDSTTESSTVQESTSTTESSTDESQESSEETWYLNGTWSVDVDKTNKVNSKKISEVYGFDAYHPSSILNFKKVNQSTWTMSLGASGWAGTHTRNGDNSYLLHIHDDQNTYDIEDLTVEKVKGSDEIFMTFHDKRPGHGEYWKIYWYSWD